MVASRYQCNGCDLRPGRIRLSPVVGNDRTGGRPRRPCWRSSGNRTGESPPLGGVCTGGGSHGGLRCRWPSSRGALTITIAHITFATGFAAVVIRTRLGGLDQALEDLRAFESKEVAALLRGEQYETLWARQR